MDRQTRRNYRSAGATSEIDTSVHPPAAMADDLWRRVHAPVPQSEVTAQPRSQGWNLPRPRRWSIPQPRRWRVWRPRNWTTRRWEKHLVTVPVYVEARKR